MRPSAARLCRINLFALVIGGQLVALIGAPVAVAGSPPPYLLAFTTSQNVFVARADGSDIRQVGYFAGHTAGVAWSPDHNWLAYGGNGCDLMSCAASNAAVRVVAADGSRTQTIA